MSALLIVNPFASGVDEHRLAAVQASLPEGTQTRLTTAPGEATEIARAAGEADAIYVLGGDGTYNEVLNGVEADIPLGFLPELVPWVLRISPPPGRSPGGGALGSPGGGWGARGTRSRPHSESPRAQRDGSGSGA